jgi:hypothetical protein
VGFALNELDVVLVDKLVADGLVGHLAGEVVDLDGEGRLDNLAEHGEGEAEAVECFLRVCQY